MTLDIFHMSTTLVLISLWITLYNASNFFARFYLVVEFPNEPTEDGSIPTAVVSSSWTFEDADSGEFCCAWPPFKSDDHRKKAVMAHKAIDFENCAVCNINVKYKTDSYQKAVSKLKQLECQSDLNSENDKRIRKGINKYLEDYVTDTSPSISPPTPPKTTKPLKIQLERVDNTSSVSPLLPPKTRKPLKVLQERVDNTREVTNDIVESAPILCASCATIEDMCSKILTVLEKNSRKLDSLNQLVNACIAEKGELAPIVDQCDNLPIKTDEELQSMEASLNSRDEYTKIFNTLKYTGGKDIFDGTRRLMSKLIGNELALQLNWTGRNNKPAFKNCSNILSLITEVIRGNPLMKSASDLDIYSVIKTWLRGAVDRDGGRIKRKNILL